MLLSAGGLRGRPMLHRHCCRSARALLLGVFLARVLALLGPALAGGLVDPAMAEDGGSGSGGEGMGTAAVTTANRKAARMAEAAAISCPAAVARRR